jgi:hypothetical protein
MFARWFARTAKDRPRRAVRLQLEPLETRLAPAVAPWTRYSPAHGDLVDRLISQLAPRAHDPAVFFQRLAAWTSESVGAENAGSLGADANRQLADLVGDCTVRANIFRTVAGRLGFSTRYVGLSNIPFQLTHSTVEVSWGRAWHYFDPTTGIHLARAGRSEALSLSAARWRWPDVTMVSPVIRRFQHRWSGQTAYRFQQLREGRITYRGRNAYDLLRTYFFSQAIESSGRQPASVRAFIDLAQRPAGAVGRSDRSTADVARFLQSAGAKLGARLATSFGSFGGSPTTLEFLLKSRRAADTSFRLTLARGNPAQVEADLDPLVARWGYPDMQVKKSVVGRSVTFRFRTLAPGVMFRLYAPQRATFRIDAYDWRVGTARTTRLAPFAPLAAYVRASAAPDTGSPRYVDLASTRSGALGSVDGNSGDLAGFYHTASYGRIFTPWLNRIGAHDEAFTGQQFIFHVGARPRSVSLTVLVVQGAEVNADVIAPGRGRAAVVAKTGVPGGWRFTFYASGPLATLRLSVASGNSAAIDAYVWQG